MEDSIAMDSLPYIDTAYGDETVRKQVEQLIREELRTYKPDLSTYLSHLPPVPSYSFETSAFMQAELARVASKTPLQPVDIGKYEVAEPSVASPESYAQAVQLASSALEYQRLRTLNAELLQKYGPNAWRIYNTNYDVLAKKLQEQIEVLKNETDELNRCRKRDQLNVAPSFRNLDAQYYELVQKAADLSGVLAGLESEVSELESRKRKSEGGDAESGKRHENA